MAQQSELAQTRVVTQDGIVTATVVDNLSVDRLGIMLVKAAAGARLSGAADDSALISREVKDLVIFPFSEL
jgi:hypothetical protein